ncbi:MAG: hypothetical protein JW884_08145, partial [Deltaproteobacteria bacterium]|nr:hypothetical protein [Deltaproteobacteria bacterium]
GSQVVNAGSSKSFTIAANANYHISNVTVDGTSVGAVSSYTFSNVASNHTIQATFALNTYTIIASAGSNGGITPSGSQVVNAGSSKSFTIAANANYHIVDVMVDGTSVGAVSSYTFSNVASNHTIQASFDSGNQAPSADAGPDQMVDERTAVTLNGSNSFDPENGIASYYWEQTEGPAVEIADRHAMATTFVAPDVSMDGATLMFKLTVVDDGGLASEDMCIVNVSWVNIQPVADAGQDINAGAQTEVALTGSNSFDLDDGIASYFWEQIGGPAVQLSDQNARDITFTTPDVSMDGAALQLRLTVTDTGGLKAQDTCVVNVTWVNEAPQADAGDDQTVSEGQSVALNGSGSKDSDDGIVSYRWSQIEGIPATLSNPTDCNPTFQAPAIALNEETLRFQLTVVDGGGLQSQDSCYVTIKKQLIGELNIDLRQGWNMISFPGQVIDPHVETVFGSIMASVESIWAFDNNVWKYYDASNAKNRTLTTVRGLQGYWVKMKKSTTLKISLGAPVSFLELQKGWNLIGWSGSDLCPLGEALASIDGKYESVWTYGETGWQYEAPSLPKSSTLTQMKIGMGYWINMEEAATWLLPN